ncbi:MAG: MtrB/PioB family decaheme-associated outer membrane protein [Lysobacterales bacterium]
MNIQRKMLSQAIRDHLVRGSLWATVLAVAISGSGVQAQDDFALDGEDQAPAQNLEELLEEQTVVKSEIEVGFGDVSDPSYRFGRYTGLEDEGLFPIVNLDIYKRGAWDGDDAGYWRLSGRNLGIESRELSFEFGQQGRYDFHIGFDEIPHYQLDDAQTIFTNPGSTNLTLPTGWVAGQTTATMTQLLPSLRTFGIEHSRKRFDVGGDLVLPSGWHFDANYSREQKDGNKTIALTIGNSGGNPRAVLAPEPVDYETQQLDAVLSFADATKQFSVGYYVSLFNDGNSSLIWQNPYSTISGWTATANVGYPTGQGQMHLEPDNQFHQINLSGGWSFSKTTRLSANVSFGRGTQNEDFLPYTINPAIAATITQPLPVSSLDGEVDTTYVGLRLTSQPWDTLAVAASYKLDDHDNKTEEHEFVYIGGDSLAQNTAATSNQRRYNEPKSYKIQAFKLDGTWNAAEWLRVSGEAEWRSTERPHQEREEIDENRYALNFALEGSEYWSGGVRLTDSTRDGGSEYLGYETLLGGYAPGYYNTLLPLVGGFPFENLPGLRKYNQADRDRQNGEVYASFMPDEAVAISASIDYSEDDYRNSELGLTFSRVSAYNVDVSWAPTDKTSAYAFASEERYKSDQDGRSFAGGAVRPTQYIDPTRNWTVQSRDYVFSYGVGFNTKVWEDKLTLGFDYVNSKADTDILTTTGSALTRADLPTSTSDLASASVYGDYRWRKDIVFHLRVAWEDYASTDWAVDNAPANQLANVITLGEGSPDYNVVVTTFTVGYRF